MKVTDIHDFVYTTIIQVGLYSGSDSDATDLQCRFQHRYHIAAITHVIADHH